MIKMAAFTTYLQQNLAAVVALIVGFVPLLVYILTLLGNRPEKIMAPLDPLIKVRNIERIAVSKDTWKELSIIELRHELIIIVFCLLILIPLYFLHELIDIVLIILIITLLAIIISRTVGNIILNRYKYRIRNCEAAKYYVFQDPKIIVEAELDYIFSKAQEAIIGKHVKYVDADRGELTINAYHDGGATTTKGKISVTIQPVEEYYNYYEIVIDFTPMPHNLINIFALAIPQSRQLPLLKVFARLRSFTRRTLKITHLDWITRAPKIKAKKIEENAKIINHFLNKFLATTPAK